MTFQIRALRDNDIEDLVQLSLRAWVPIFESFRHILGPSIYRIIYPDWTRMQRETVETVCRDGDKTTVWVADFAGSVVGFVAYELHDQDKSGEVQLLAVHPDFQNQGIGTELNRFALTKMKENGMRLAVVGTGGDPSHAPARRSYEKAGYLPLPLVRYYQDL